jgi:DNA-binding response OmpR family regulator
VSKILIIEDDQDIRYLYQKAVQFQGIDVDMAKDGEEGLSMIAQTKYDLVLLDLLLPGGKNGIDFLTEVRKQIAGGHEMPIMVVTHLKDDSVKQQAMVLGASAYLIKNESGIGDVIRQVHQLLGSMPQAQPQATSQPAESQPSQPQPQQPESQPETGTTPEQGV